MRRAPRRRPSFDKYEFYRRAVQSPENDVRWMRRIFRRIRGRDALVFREDFCGTGLLSATWVGLDSRFRALGVDINQEPMRYGREHYIGALPADVAERVTLRQVNVLSRRLPRADLVAAMNFSFFVFRERALLLRYFRGVRRSLHSRGLFVLDAFGGSECQGPSLDSRREEGFTYYWEQEGFDPVTHEGRFHMHFRVAGRMHRRAFSYHWRMWSIPEIRELLAEAGFRKTHVYWEGTSPDGRGNGRFTLTEKGESCESWIAYVVAEV